MLPTVREKSLLFPVALKIFIVQTGVSKGKVRHDQLILLSVAENYLV